MEFDNIIAKRVGSYLLKIAAKLAMTIVFVNITVAGTARKSHPLPMTFPISEECRAIGADTPTVHLSTIL